MDSPSSDLRLQAPLVDRDVEVAGARLGEAGRGRASLNDVLVIASSRDPVAADFAAFVRRKSPGLPVVVADREGRALLGESGREPTSLILFLADRPSEQERRGLSELLNAASRWPLRFVGIVGSFRVHLDDPAAEEAERHALSLLRSSGIPARVAVFRPGLLLSPNSAVSRWLERLGPLYPLAQNSLRTCFVEGEEFFAFIEAERSLEDVDGGIDVADPSPEGRSVGRRRRAYTLLGANLSWRQMLERHRGVSRRHRLTTAIASFLSRFLLGRVIALVVGLSAKWTSRARPWSVQTLKPRSMGELVTLCHRANIDRVRVVGYNNGVNHFGHRHPGRTIVSTVRCRRTSRDGRGMLKADCGATIRDARDALQEHGEELYVVPNYSYVAVGTSFFVPIHGSAVDYSTVADTAARVVLYDPDRDRIVSATRDDPAFRQNVYNPRSRTVVLRLYLRVKPKSSYFVRRETRKNAAAEELLAALQDREAANVEIRQGHAASGEVSIAKSYTSPGDPSEPALESPRDSLGRLWDRLEENPVTSFLMHALSRHLAWHTELFFNATEFELFWRTHAQVPLRKIQLRYIRRDGMPHSPFRDEDCVSADLFLFRYDKPAFDAYLDRTLPSVRTNPGKHSN